LSVPVTKRQLSASIRASLHIDNHSTIAAFILHDATVFGANPFRHTSAGAQRQTWSGRCHEFRALAIPCIGLPGLLQRLAFLPIDEPLEQEVLRAGPFTAYVYHHGDGCRIVGAVLHGQSNIPLPAPTRSKACGRPRAYRVGGSEQLDLFLSPCP
jgi:hypothetical protein